MKNKTSRKHTKHHTKIEMLSLSAFIFLGLISGPFFISQGFTGLAVDEPAYAASSMVIIGWTLVILALIIILYLVSNKIKKSHS